MAKNYYVHITGDDYSAMHYEETPQIQEYVERMLLTGDKQERVVYQEADVYLEARLLEFGEVDPDFEHYIKENLSDYDIMKSENIFFLKRVVDNKDLNLKYYKEKMRKALEK